MKNTSSLILEDQVKIGEFTLMIDSNDNGFYLYNPSEPNDKVLTYYFGDDNPKSILRSMFEEPMKLGNGKFPEVPSLEHIRIVVDKLIAADKELNNSCSDNKSTKIKLKLDQVIKIGNFELVVRKGYGWYLLNDRVGANNDSILEIYFGSDYRKHMVEMFGEKNVLEGNFPELRYLSDLEILVDKLLDTFVYNPSKHNVVTLEQFGKYINKACDKWQNKLIGEYGSNVLKCGVVKINRGTIVEMLNAANQKQEKVIKMLFPFHR